MNPWPVDAEVEEVHLPRPGHADLAGPQKYGHADVRNVLERASARETAARVAAGAIAKELPARARRRASTATCSRSPRCGAAERDDLGARGLRRRRRVAGPLPRPGGERGDGRRDRPAAQGEREPRRHLRGARLRPRARARLARLLGGAPRRPPGPGAVVSIQAVKGVSVGEAWEVAGLPGLGVPRRDLLVRGARLAPRDQPRRRRRGRDDQRRAARRARRR